MTTEDHPSFDPPGYRIIRALAHGVRTTVYEAVSTRQNRPVALKVLDAPSGGEGDGQWFLRVARAAAALEHPGIVPCWEVGSHGNRPYIVFPLLPGLSLDGRIRSGTVYRAADAISLVRSVAAALDFAHGRGIVHGFLHPTHILIGLDNRPQLIGFAEHPYSAGGEFQVVGNPLHQAPEFFRDAMPSVSPLTDVYMLAETAFFLLAGEHPFYRHHTPIHELVAAKESAAAPNVCDFRPELPPAADGVLRRGMAARPADRFRSGGEFAEALAAAVETRTTRWWQFWA